MLLVSTEEVREVESAQAIVLLPISVLPEHVDSTVQFFGPIKASSITETPGRLIVTYEHPRIATIAYGAVQTTKTPSPIQITSGSDALNKGHALSFGPEGTQRTFDQRINQVESALHNRPTLTKEDLDKPKVPLSIHRVKDLVNR